MTDEKIKMNADAFLTNMEALLNKGNNLFYGAIEALTSAESDDEIKTNAAVVVGTFHNLGTSIVSTLSTIAWAQLRMVELAETDMDAAVKAAAEPMAQAIVKNNAERSYIGKKPG